VHCDVDHALTVEIVIGALKFSNKGYVIFKCHKSSGVTYFIPVVHYNKTIALPNEKQFKNNTG
jgi:23S rRNA C2498 (ribose-2'-O)-methylase RlmM